jgi:hypothetical protein
MPRAGLADATLELLRAAVTDEETVARFHAEIRTLPGVGSQGVVLGGVGARPVFWLTTAGGRDVVDFALRCDQALEKRLTAQRPAITRSASSAAPS